MQMKLPGEGEQRAFALVLDTGHEVVATLERFAQKHALDAAQFTAIGAFRLATQGYFEWQQKDYEGVPVEEQVEVAMLAGEVALQGGQRKMHAHGSLRKRNGAAVPGHPLEAEIRPTLEPMLTESPAHLRRIHDPETGLALTGIAS